MWFSTSLFNSDISLHKHDGCEEEFHTLLQGAFSSKTESNNTLMKTFKSSVVPACRPFRVKLSESKSKLKMWPHEPKKLAVFQTFL